MVDLYTKAFLETNLNIISTGGKKPSYFIILGDVHKGTKIGTPNCTGILPGLWQFLLPKISTVFWQLGFGLLKAGDPNPVFPNSWWFSCASLFLDLFSIEKTNILRQSQRRYQKHLKNTINDKNDERSQKLPKTQSTHSLRTPKTLAPDASAALPLWTLELWSPFAAKATDRCLGPNNSQSHRWGGVLTSGGRYVEGFRLVFHGFLVFVCCICLTTAAAYYLLLVLLLLGYWTMILIMMLWPSESTTKRFGQLAGLLSTMQLLWGLKKPFTQWGASIQRSMT